MRNYSFTFTCKGHKHIQALHKSTIEVTREASLTLRGDCIIGIKATHAPRDFPEILKELIQNDKAKITVSFVTPEAIEVVEGRGHHNLTLTDATSFVIRKSGYTCSRTLMIHANKAAKDLSRELVKYLQSPSATMQITIAATLA